MIDTTPHIITALLAMGMALAFIVADEWILRVRRTVPARNLKTHGPDALLRIAQGLTFYYVAMSIAFPRMRVEHFLNAGFHEVFERGSPGILLFATSTPRDHS